MTAWDPLVTRLLDEELTYDGSQIRSHWAMKTLDLAGDSMVAFLGPCSVSLEAMVDLEDSLAIEAKSMLHFVCEHFGVDLEVGVLRQRLFAAILCDEVNRRAPGSVVRRGDDLFTEDGGKLSVSIAAPTPVSVKIHFGLNIDPEGAPVKARGLASLGIDPGDLARTALKAYRSEMAGIARARTKVRAAP